MITAPEGTALYYRQLVAYVRSRNFRRENGSPDSALLDYQRLQRARSVLVFGSTSKSTKALRATIAQALEAMSLDDEALLAIIKADDAVKVERWEAKAAEIEALEAREAQAAVSP